MMDLSKDALLTSGWNRAMAFCNQNSVPPPELRVQSPDVFRIRSACAYYRPSYVAICLEKCAHVGRQASAWSWPGYVIDRTPYGVVAHELGHHCDHLIGIRRQSYSSEYSIAVRAESGEEKLTNYCPNDAEWFAEMFRLFVTNPDLLAELRPRTFRALERTWTPVVTETWPFVLEDAPERTVQMAYKKIRESKRTQGVLL